ncbi:Flp pilus assembly protein CpaB [Bosea sp. Tri-44]|uniref:Flp pilus assembly protein CpaB n=1 Tax=Bosea sp. Tri-44 TaxID=1972137 RepID=UPI00100DB1F7|nr:Flp pilus assembly protein CpaB [Bosea sp. Tri-44]RXT43550.1 Flp pilus assembly protein CpaB [Bosea sp. Tri-44]
MSPARIIILAVAVVAGLGAALLISQPPKVTTPSETTYAPAPTVEVLVAAADVPLGNKLAAGDLKWLAWPLASLPTEVIRRQDLPGGEGEFVGQIARAQLYSSEPIRREKLLKADSGFLSAILPPGKRAVAITTDNRGANTAGGFILPNDRVDIIRTTRDDSNSRDGAPAASETLVANVRVLAIGQNIQEKNGEKVVIGETATLELDPKHVEAVTLAQKTSTLSLALRSLQDAGDKSPPSDEGGLTLVRFGVVTKAVKP